MTSATSDETYLGSKELRQVRDQERKLRRLSGDIACANCRKLKLRCDKKLPCSSCVKRGTGDFCPLGFDDQSRTPSRRPSCQTCERWKRKVALLTDRVRALEDALASESKARGVFELHPLLTNELLAVKHSPVDDESEDENEGKPDQSLDAFGTLSIDESETMRYLGPSASESALLLEVLETAAPRLQTNGSHHAELSHLSQEITHSGRSFPFSPPSLDQSKDDLLSQLVCHLPPFERAVALCEFFFRNLSWFFAPVERSHFVTEVIPMFYPHRRPVLPGSVCIERAHDLALLFAFFACGAVGDLTQKPANSEAEQYNTLARAALSVRSIMRGASLSGVQTLYLLAGYDVYTAEKKSQEESLKLVALGSCMAVSIGLHRDPSRWGFDDNMAERRRRVFWEIYLINTWRSLESGRPPILRPSIVDCEFPRDISSVVEGEILESVNQWRFRFCRDVVSEVCEKVTSARPLRYRDVLKLDQKIRDFPTHSLVKNGRPEATPLDMAAELPRMFPLITIWVKEEALLFAHRNFFAKAILDFPDDPMGSPFGVSFRATYRSAANLIGIVREHIHALYRNFLRIWNVWSIALSSGVVVGAIASLGKSTSLATQAFTELEDIIAVFETYCEHTVAKHGLPFLRRIRERAISALRQSGKHHPSTDDSSARHSTNPTSRADVDDPGDELLILRGMPRTVERRISPLLEYESSLPPSQTTTPGPGAEGSGDFGHPNNTFLPHDQPVARDQHHTGSMEGVHNARSSFRITPEAANLHAPQADPDMQYRQLNRNAISSAIPPQSIASVVSNDPNEDIPTHAPQVAYHPQPIPVATTPYIPAYSPTHFSVPTSGTATFVHDVPLNETVSTQEWNQFIQQYGFSDASSFNFVHGSFFPHGYAAAPEWQANAT